MKILILVCYLFISNPENNAKTDILNHLIQTDTSRYIVLKLNNIPDYIFDKSYKPAKLTITDINEIDNLINKAVKKHNKTATKYFQIENPSRYYKQFIAAINSKGEKIAWANCFCSIKDVNYWKKSAVLSADGGNCYFKLKINLSKGTTYDFTVNNRE